MNRRLSAVGRLGIRGLAIPLMAALLIAGPSALPASAGTPSHFASLTKPIGVAAMSSRVLATEFCRDKVYSLSATGAVSTFVDLPSTNNSCIERYLAVSPGLPGFAKDTVYAVQNQTVYEIPASGGSATAFAKIPSLPNGETGITFDTIGTFGNKMILTDRHGPIWTVNSAGVATRLGSVGQQIEGPEVAPLSFGAFGGQVLVGNEYTDQVFAMDANGRVSQVVSYDSPEAIRFIPGTVCNFGTSGGAYFQANEDTNEIVKFPAGNFTGLSGALLPSELGSTIGRMFISQGNVKVTTFQAAMGGALEGGAFHPCS